MNSNLRVIGLTGYARSGKDSAAAVLAEIAGFERIAFADALRDMALAINPILAYVAPGSGRDVEWFGMTGTIRYSDVVQRVGYEQAKTRPEVRQYLQRMGNEGVRHVLGKHTWVRVWKDRVLERLRKGPANIVVTDVRFVNEAEAVQSEGQLWRIVRPGTGAANSHASELEQDSFVPDVTIVANNLTELRQGVIDAWEAIR